MTFTREEKHASAVRELALRRRNYPRWIAIGRITPGEAEREIALMEAISADYAPEDLFTRGGET